MECYCEPMEVEEYCTVWNVTWRTARKQHKCCECGEIINPGERYEHIFSVFEDEVTVYKTCQFCADEFKRLAKKHTDMNMVKGDLACVLVWDMRNEAERFDIQEGRP